MPNGLKVWQWNKGETDWLYEEIFQDDLYTSRKIKLDPGAVVFDCGANIGLFALFCHHKTGGKVQVHSFEPMPKIHAVCAANAKRFGGEDKHLKTYQVGVSDKPSKVTFDFHPHFSIWSTSDAAFDKSREERLMRDMPSILHQVRWMPNFIGVPLGRWLIRSVLNKVEKVEAELTTVSHMIQQTGVERIDLLKIDVEGAEIAVLKVRPRPDPALSGGAAAKQREHVQPGVCCSRFVSPLWCRVQGVSDADWPKVQQVVLEAEDFKSVEVIRGILASKGFAVHAFASEREKMPGVTSEVSCVMAVRE